MYVYMGLVPPERRGPPPPPWGPRGGAAPTVRADPPLGIHEITEQSHKIDNNPISNDL